MEKILTFGDKLLIVICNLGVACIFMGMFFLGMTPSLDKDAVALSVGFCLMGVLFVVYSVYMDGRKRH